MPCFRRRGSAPRWPWAALEALEERAEFLGRVADRHGDRRPRLRDRFSSAAADAVERADLIRQTLGIREQTPEAFDVQGSEPPE